MTKSIAKQPMTVLSDAEIDLVSGGSPNKQDAYTFSNSSGQSDTYSASRQNGNSKNGLGDNASHWY